MHRDPNADVFLGQDTSSPAPDWRGASTTRVGRTPAWRDSFSLTLVDCRPMFELVDSGNRPACGREWQVAFRRSLVAQSSTPAPSACAVGTSPGEPVSRLVGVIQTAITGSGQALVARHETGVCA
jgi:hypothetical protein